MKFLTNAPKKKARRKARFTKGSAAAKAYMKSIRPHTKGGSTVAKKRRTKKRTASSIKRTVTRRRTHTRSNPPTRLRKVSRRRRFRRNPPGMGGIMFYLAPKNLMGGVIDAGEVLVGKVVVRTVPGLIGFGSSDTIGLAIQALTAIVAGGVAHTFVNHNAGKMVLAGGLAAPLETLIKSLNIPLISSALGEDTVEVVQDGMGGYVQIPQGMGSYVQPGVGAYDYNEQQYQQ